MRWIFLLAILVAFSLVDCGSRAESSDWAWGKGRESKASDAGAGTNSYLVNATTNAAEDEESLIDTIVSSTRQGRNLQQDGYNQVAADPQVRKAIEDGDDAQARHYIREKLCDLGLMACEPGIEPKRPYVQPHDLIYAQPVAIKPVGRPIPALPVRGPHGPGYGPPGPGYGPPGPGYGPPKPIPFPPGPGPIFRPPRPVPGPIYGSPKPIPPPVHEPVEHDYLPHPPIKKPVDVVVNNHGGVQQHVHHHYHHSEGGVVKPSVVVDHPSPIVPTGPLYEPGPSFGSIGTGSLYGTGPTVGPVYGGATGGPIYGGPTLGPVYGGSGPYLGQGSFYKKELSIKTPLTGNGLGSTASSTNYAEKYPSYQNPRVDGVRGLGDCVCVPFDQCLPHEVARKDGYYIDPRHNGGKNIEAITLDDVVITDGNGTVISRHAKREDSAQEIFAEVDEQEKTGEATEVVTTTEVAKDEAEEKTETRKRREAPVTKDENGNDASKSNVHPRLFGDTSKYKVSPTFGVSFGLPQGGGGYPLNPYGPNPAINPYGGSVGGLGGVNLGLVSVNPLLSVQVTQDEYGDKIVKPLVNLHVTPNQGLVHKFGSLIHGLHHKPYYPTYHPYKQYHNHHHVHTMKPYPSYYYPYKQPSYYYGWHKPNYHYAPHYYGYRASNDYDASGSGHYSSGYVSDEEDLQEQYDNDYVDDPYSSYSRQSRGNHTAVAPNTVSSQPPSSSDSRGATKVQFPSDRRRSFNTRTKRQVTPDRIQDTSANNEVMPVQERQAFYGGQQCGPRYVCCRRPLQPHRPQYPQGGGLQCGRRHAQGVNGRIKNPVYVDGDSEFGEYPWQVAILKKDVQESVYVCGGTLIDNLHILTAAHCVKTYNGQDLRVRLGEWDVNHDVEFYPYEERDVANVHIHPEFYAGTLYNDIAVLKLTHPIDTVRSPHIAPACLPDQNSDYTGSRCWTTGWGKDAFGDYGKYQNILKEVDVPIVSFQQCQLQLQQTRLGYDYKLHPGMICAGGEEGKDACKGDGGGPLVCERGGTWQVVGIVSWGIGCGQHGVPGVYVNVAHYLNWIRHIVNNRY
ncbi:uncharacterized protein [Periplaneta americana]|uniref:uncharacterized protein isoform X1 n=1 Tax=Periplaneta americana TaxID=6978 RepID=UPI0037E80C3B